MDIQSYKKLQEIVDKDPNIEIIEIWERVLYIRRKKGRNTFHTKKGITTLTSGIYLNTIEFSKDEYKRLQNKYHPDRNPKYLHISKGINQWKELLLRHLEGEFNRGLYNFIIDTYPTDRSIFTTLESIDLSFIKTTRFLDGPIKSREQQAAEKAERARRREENFNWQRGRVKEDYYNQFNVPF